MSLLKGMICMGVVAAASFATCAVLYTNTTVDPFAAYGNLDPNVVMLDDVLIPPARVGDQPKVAIRKATVELWTRVAGTYQVKAWAAVGGFNQAGNLVPMLPPTQVGTASVVSNGFGKRNVDFGNGTTAFFDVFLRNVSAQGTPYKMFFFGLSFDAPLDKIGWSLADGPDFNLNGFYGYYGPNSPQNGFKTYADGLKASFNLKLEGYPVPSAQPGFVLLMGLIGMRSGTRAARKMSSSQTGTGRMRT
jgi:hypothetical protein